MTLTIDSDILDAAGLGEDQLKLALAVHLYQQRRLSLGKAAELCGWHRSDVQQELARRGVELHYTVAAYEMDLANLHALGRL